MVASLSMILSCTVATSEKQGRLLHPAAAANLDSDPVNSISRKHGGLLKTDFGDDGKYQVVGEGKTIDYTLYNYGGSAVLSLSKNKNTALGFNDTQASTIAALGNAALILGGKN